MITLNMNVGYLFTDSHAKFLIKDSATQPLPPPPPGTKQSGAITICAFYYVHEFHDYC